MIIYLFLAYNRFSIFDFRTWLAPFVRLATYFRGRGLNGEVIRWHHCGIAVEYNGNTTVYEALSQGVVKGDVSNLDQYELVKFIKIDAINEHKFIKYLDRQVGVKYNYFLVMFVKLIYQLFGIWILKNKPKKHDCATLVAEGLNKCLVYNKDRNIYKEWERFDPQDFVRIFIKQ